MRDVELVLAWLVGVGFVIFLVVAAVGGIHSCNVTQTCLKAGYPEGEVTRILGDDYCHKRVDQTDVVVPLVDGKIAPAEAPTP